MADDRATMRASDSRVLRFGYKLVTANLWLRTTILLVISVASILLAFHWHVMTKPTIGSFLASQLGTGLLVGAVGSALVQAIIMSAPRKMQELIDELRSRSSDATLADRLAELTAALHAHDLRSRTAAGDMLGRLGVLDILPTVEKTTAATSAALADPAVTEVRLLGLSLGTWFDSGRHSSDSDWPGRRLERLLLDTDSLTVSRGPLRVRVLLLDPECLSPRLLAHGPARESSEELHRLCSEARQTTEHLIGVSREVADRQNGNSLQVRFYRSTPALFLFATNQGALMRSYYHGLADAPPSASAAVWHYSVDSAAFRAACRHFDTIWDVDSVSCDDSPMSMEIGIDRGTREAGITNVYTDRESAQKRIQWLISHASQRVWIQGVSLSHHLNPPLIDAIHRLAKSPGIDTRVLFLAPNCDQAIRKSYQSYLLDRNNDTSLDYGEYAHDSRLHQASDLYEKLQRSTRDFRDLRAKSADHFQVRQYDCAPTSYILIADDHVLIEQFHYGKPVHATDSIDARLQLASEMPLVEYTRPESALFPPKAEVNPVAVIENHFIQVFQRFGSPIPPA